MPLDANQTYDIVRPISKVGGLALASETTLDVAASLSTAEKISLYRQVKEESQRYETEWRTEFCERIRIDFADLPDMKTPTNVIMDLLQQAVECPDPEDFVDAIEGFDDGTGYDKNTLRTKITELGFRPLLRALEEY